MPKPKALPCPTHALSTQTPRWGYHQHPAAATHEVHRAPIILITVRRRQELTTYSKQQLGSFGRDSLVGSDSGLVGACRCAVHLAERTVSLTYIFCPHFSNNKSIGVYPLGCAFRVLLKLKLLKSMPEGRLQGWLWLRVPGAAS